MSETAIRTYAAARHFSAATLTRWLAAADADRDALLRLAESLRLGENQLRDLFDDLADVAARQGTSIAAVCGGGEVGAVLGRGLGRNEAIRALKLALRHLRYPQLSAAEQRLAELAKRLRLPAGVRVAFPEHLEGEHVSVTLRARSTSELLAQAAAVAGADAATIEEMFALLEGRW